MASELKVDKFTGVSTAGSISVTGEGNSTTTNLQQGLAKAWGHIATANSTTFDDSFMFGTVTDNGTGDWTYAFTNNMANNDYSFVSIHGDAASNSAFSRSRTFATGSIQFNTYIGSGTTDATLITTTVHGDLA
ncbi:MAG: hypothetical protein CBC24_08085 [Candidatus Pelagibacter sp. TMED64]|jgi:hypothetical protein|nr:MAG: hypothetical protein CBC24_08085 [Candidatus Pelagibacter sp. TMED64]